MPCFSSSGGRVRRCRDRQGTHLCTTKTGRTRTCRESALVRCRHSAHSTSRFSPRCTQITISQFDFSRSPPVLRTRGHRFSVTSAVASEDGKYMYTSGKEGSIVKWDLHTGSRLASFPKLRPPKAEASGHSKKKGKEKAGPADVNGHTDEVLTLALSGDGRYLASAGKDRRVGVWDTEKDEWVKGFGGHRDTISVRLKKSQHRSFP